MADCYAIPAELARKQECLNVMIELLYSEDIYSRFPRVDRELPLDPVPMIGHFTKLSDLCKRASARSP